MIDFRDIAALVAATRSGTLPIAQVVEEVLDALSLARRPEAWLQTVAPEALRRRAAELDSRRSEAEGLPLYGVPFAVKDNIDAAGLATTAGCPAFSYLPAEDSFAVALLLRAGAVLVGKTHMDQFATGLTGTRSPHGPCRNAHVASRISGGSSSGSAVAVAEGIVAFALGTDTAGSGRVPAVLNGIVGLKPTRGRVSTSGVVPACASLDCVSVFAASCTDAAAVLAVLDQFDAADAWSRPMAACGASSASGGQSRSPQPRAEATSSTTNAVALSGPRLDGLRVGVPSPLPEVVGAEAGELFRAAVATLVDLGAATIPVDFQPFLATAQLLYGGGWTAERDAAFGDFLRAHPEAVDPTVASIVTGGERPDGRRVFESLHELAQLRRRCDKVWSDIDVLVVPTVPEPFRIADVMASPLVASASCGATNNFLNLLDLTGCAVPTAAWGCGVPFGVTLCAPAGGEGVLVDVGARLQAATADRVPRLARPTRIALAVVGAHLAGMPLHHQLTALDARLLAKTRTCPGYRLYALAGTTPPKPGLQRVVEGGAAIEVEVYALSPEAFGRFVAAVPRPLAIGRIELEDASEVSGFVCEPQGFDGAQDITNFGGWRAWCASRAKEPERGTQA